MMPKQKQIVSDKSEKHCVVFVVKEGNGTKLYEHLKQDPKLKPIYHWVQGEWNEKDKV